MDRVQPTTGQLVAVGALVLATVVVGRDEPTLAAAPPNTANGTVGSDLGHRSLDRVPTPR